MNVVVLMRSFHPFSGGAETQALRLSEAMRARGVDVRVVTQRRGGLPARDVHHGVPIHRVRTLADGHLAPLTFLASSFAWLLRNRRTIDVIQTNRTTSGLIAGLAGLALRLPVVCKLTGGGEIADKGFRVTRFGRLKVRVLRRVVSRFVAITAAIERELVAAGIPAEKIVRIPNGIEPRPARDAAAARAALGLAPETPLVTVVGRLIPEKGVDDLLSAWREILRRRPTARLWIVGDGPHRPALALRAEALGLAGSVDLLGHRSDVDRILEASDVFVLPSHREGMSNALLEAMGAGLPVVVTDDRAGGNVEIVTNEDDGLVVPVADPAAIEQAVGRLLDDPIARRRLGDRARETVGRRFSMAAVAERYLALYDALRGTEAASSRAVAVAR